MTDLPPVKAAIVDYGLGNLFSVKHACDHVGLTSVVTSNIQEIRSADAIILPGVGAFGDAMAALKRSGLVEPVREAVHLGTPLVGICLGMQLLMTESYEFGRHTGLGLVEGSVVRFESLSSANGRLKVPHVGWNRISRPGGRWAGAQQEGSDSDPWLGSPLAGLPEGEFVYFVHSFYVKPADAGVVLAVSSYGNYEFCSALRLRNIFGFQFHPERSGPQGLKIYENVASCVMDYVKTWRS